MIKKRGISPLIATVLLVAFVIALLAIVFLWGRQFIEERAVKEGAKAKGTLSCSTDIEIKISNAYISEDNKVYVTIENSKSNTVDGFVIRIYGENGVEPIDIYQPLKPLEVSTVTSTFDESVTGNVNEVEVIPRLRIAKGIFIPCAQQKVTYKLK